MANEPQPGCLRCGGDRLTWRIKRNRSAGRDSHRTLLWSCGGCGAEWAEPLSVRVEHVVQEQPTG
jgi:DNA-directed RNA polymerase subunit M/transcription elongation factor TFIIS